MINNLILLTWKKNTSPILSLIFASPSFPLLLRSQVHGTGQEAALRAKKELVAGPYLTFLEHRWLGWLHFFFYQLIVQGCRGGLTLGGDHLVTVVLLGELEKAR